MAKLVKIDDRKPLEIFIGRRTEGPVKMRMDEGVIGRLLRSKDGPRTMYALNPKNEAQKVVLTMDNYLIPEAELFVEKKPVITPVVKEEVKVEEPAKVETTTKVTEEIKEETSTFEESLKKLAATQEEKKEEESSTEETKEEKPVSKQNYHNNYKKNNYKNNKKN